MSEINFELQALAETQREALIEVEYDEFMNTMYQRFVDALEEMEMLEDLEMYA